MPRAASRNGARPAASESSPPSSPSTSPHSSRSCRAEFSAPTVKQHLAALRMLFDWLVTGHVLDVNPAHAVRGPKYVVKKGKTPVLTAEEARELLDSIAITRNTAREDGPETEEPALIGLRDRALIAVMVYTFARVNAVLEMKVRDYFVQGRRGWVRLHEKGGKEHEVPCHHNLEQYLDEYIAAAGIAEDPDGPLFRTAAGKTGVLTGNAMWQQDAYRMIQRRAAPPASRPGSATTPSAPPASPRTCRTRARSKPLSNSPITSRPGRPSSTTGARMKFRWTR